MQMTRRSALGLFAAVPLVGISTPEALAAPKAPWYTSADQARQRLDAAIASCQADGYTAAADALIVVRDDLTLVINVYGPR